METTYINEKYSALAGALISLGGGANMICENKMFGAVIFSLGLCLIIRTGLQLYTGMIGFWNGNWNSLWYMLYGLFWNLLGAFVVGLAIGLVNPQIAQNASELAANKVGISPIVGLLSSMLCGAMVFFAVFVNKFPEMDTTKTILTIMCVAAFVLCGYDHCVAAVSYCSMAIPASELSVCVEYFVRTSIYIVGNTIGALCVKGMYITKNVAKYIEEE